MSSGRAAQRWRRADQPANERAEACCGAMTFEDGRHTGVEVVQLYVAAPAAAQQPPKQLKGFAKIHLDPGLSTEVSLRLDRDELAVFDGASGGWVLHQGRYEVLVGRSSRDIRGRAGFEVGARTPVGP